MVWLCIYFWATSGGKMGVATTHAPNVLTTEAFQPTKTFANCAEVLGQPLSRKNVFDILRGDPRPRPSPFNIQ